MCCAPCRCLRCCLELSSAASVAFTFGSCRYLAGSDARNKKCRFTNGHFHSRWTGLRSIRPQSSVLWKILLRNSHNPPIAPHLPTYLTIDLILFFAKQRLGLVSWRQGFFFFWCAATVTSSLASFVIRIFDRTKIFLCSLSFVKIKRADTQVYFHTFFHSVLSRYYDVFWLPHHRISSIF